MWDALRYPELSQGADSYETGAVRGTPVLGAAAADTAPLLRWHLVLILRQPEVLCVRVLPLYLFPSVANQCTWFIRTTPSLGSAVLKAGCISHFLPFTSLWPVQKAPHLHPPLTQWSQRLLWMSRSQDLAGSCKPTASPRGFLDIEGLVTSLLKTCSACQGISQCTSSTHRQLAHMNILNIKNSLNPNGHCLSQKCFSTTAKTLRRGTDGLIKQLPSPCAFWVAGTSDPAMCEWPYFQEAPSWEDCFVAARDRFS